MAIQSNTVMQLTLDSFFPCWRTNNNSGFSGLWTALLFLKAIRERNFPVLVFILTVILWRATEKKLNVAAENSKQHFQSYRSNIGFDVIQRARGGSSSLEHIWNVVGSHKGASGQHIPKPTSTKTPQIKNLLSKFVSWFLWSCTDSEEERHFCKPWVAQASG